MISIKTTDGKVIKSVTKEEAESIINSASPNDLYFVHDSSLNPPWKKQSWCDHISLDFLLALLVLFILLILLKSL